MEGALVVHSLRLQYGTWTIRDGEGKPPVHLTRAVLHVRTVLLRRQKMNIGVAPEPWKVQELQ